MPRSLANCPEDIIECIIGLLDLVDICNVRLSCYLLAQKASHHYFKTFFKSKHVDLTLKSLARFAIGTSAGGLRSLAQEIFIVGVTNKKYENKEESMEQIPDIAEMNEYEALTKVKLLRRAFDGLTLHSKPDRKLSITLRVEVMDKKRRLLPVDATPGHPQMLLSVWKSTMETYKTTMQALAWSKLQIQSLNVFTQPDMQKCSLSCEQLVGIEEIHGDLSRPLASLNSLSISLCTRISLHEGNTLVGRRVSVGAAKSREEIEDENNFRGVARLLQFCKKLDSLELHHYHIRQESSRGRPRFCAEKILQRIVELDHLPHLQHCKIRGIYAREQDLLSLVERTRPSKLFLEAIYLSEGSFEPILNHCTGQTTMDSLHLNHLHEKELEDDTRYGVIHFRSDQDTSGGMMDARETLQREGDSTRNPITYDLYHGGLIAMPRDLERQRYLRLEYG